MAIARPLPPRLDDEGVWSDSNVTFYGAPGAFPSAPAPAPPAPALAPAPPTAAGWSRLAGSLRSSAPAAAPTAAGGASAVPRATREEDREGTPLCTYFAAGLCRHGEACRFRHTKVEEWAVEYFEEELRAALADADAAKEAARHGGGGVGVGDDSAADAAGDADGGAARFDAASAAWQTAAASQRYTLLAGAVEAGVAADMGSAETALAIAERGVSRDIECGICLEHVTERPGRRFGLLTGCAHSFCLECIREWRARIDLPPTTVRSCPVCRTISYYVIPSDRFVADAARKAAANAAHLASLRATPCRNWNLGRGECPFGDSCHFVHKLPDGTDAPRGRHAFRMDSNGTISGVTGKGPLLSDFL